MIKAIHRYKLKDGVSHADIAKELKRLKIQTHEGGSYINKNSSYSFFKVLKDEIEACVAFPEDLSLWDDFDYVLVLDDSFGQPYTPFYESEKPFVYMLDIIGRYNKLMDSLSFLERKEE